MVDIASVVVPLLGVVFLGLGLKGLQVGWFYSRQSKRIGETEVDDVDSLQRGTVAVTGTAHGDEDEGTVTTALTGEDALVSESSVVAEKTVDEFGEYDESRTKTETLHEQEQAVPFLVEDATGTVHVDPPEQADVRLDNNSIEVAGDQRPEIADLADDPTAAASGTVPVGDDAGYSDWGHQYQQAAIVPGEDVFILGEAIDRADWDDSELVLTGGESPDQFVVSDLSREEVKSGSTSRKRLLYAAGGFAILVGLLMLYTTVPTLLG